MRTLDELLAISIERKGSEKEIFGAIEAPKTAAELQSVTDDRWLAAMTRVIFQAGFNWKVVDSMWPGFETAFDDFDVGRCAMMSDDKFDALCKDTSIVRYPQKIRSVQQNAVFIQEKSAAYGSFGKMVGAWPMEEFDGLLQVLKKEGTRLGATTGQYFLRFMGKDGFILSKNVVGRLMAEGVVDKVPTSISAMKAVQEAFNAWRQQSGRPFKEISRILATSYG